MIKFRGKYKWLGRQKMKFLTKFDLVGQREVFFEVWPLCSVEK